MCGGEKTTLCSLITGTPQKCASSGVEETSWVLPLQGPGCSQYPGISGVSESFLATSQCVLGLRVCLSKIIKLIRRMLQAPSTYDAPYRVRQGD